MADSFFGAFAEQQAIGRQFALEKARDIANRTMQEFNQQMERKRFQETVDEAKASNVLETKRLGIMADQTENKRNLDNANLEIKGLRLDLDTFIKNRQLDQGEEKIDVSRRNAATREGIAKSVEDLNSTRQFEMKLNDLFRRDKDKAQTEQAIANAAQIKALTPTKVEKAKTDIEKNRAEIGKIKVDTLLDKGRIGEVSARIDNILQDTKLKGLAADSYKIKNDFMEKFGATMPSAKISDPTAIANRHARMQTEVNKAHEAYAKSNGVVDELNPQLTAANNTVTAVETALTNHHFPTAPDYTPQGALAHKEETAMVPIPSDPFASAQKARQYLSAARKTRDVLAQKMIAAKKLQEITAYNYNFVNNKTKEAGAVTTIDGKPVSTVTGTKRQEVVPQSHESLPGFQTTNRPKPDANKVKPATAPQRRQQAAPQNHGRVDYHHMSDAELKRALAKKLLGQ